MVSFTRMKEDLDELTTQVKYTYCIVAFVLFLEMSCCLCCRLKQKYQERQCCGCWWQFAFSSSSSLALGSGSGRAGTVTLTPGSRFITSSPTLVRAAPLSLGGVYWPQLVRVRVLRVWVSICSVRVVGWSWVRGPVPTECGPCVEPEMIKGNSPLLLFSLFY